MHAAIACDVQCGDQDAITTRCKGGTDGGGGSLSPAGRVDVLGNAGHQTEVLAKAAEIVGMVFEEGGEVG